jgi:UDP-N-acetylmuramoylalanine--D-glutamate ligase
VRYFSGEQTVTAGAYLDDETLVLCRGGTCEPVCTREEIPLRGPHNVLNVLAAVALGDAIDVPVAAMRRAIKQFRGVEHRLEEVRRWHDVLWVNDSIATAPERVLAALDSFDEPLVLLAGGRDKDLPWEEFARNVVQRVRVLILFGEAADLISGNVRRIWEGVGRMGALQEIVRGETLTRAVDAAAQRVQSGDVVLLSPGGTSFDAYRDFAERGEHFRVLVNALGKDETEKTTDET